MFQKLSNGRENVGFGQRLPSKFSSQTFGKNLIPKERVNPLLLGEEINLVLF